MHTQRELRTTMSTRLAAAAWVMLLLVLYPMVDEATAAPGAIFVPQQSADDR